MSRLGIQLPLVEISLRIMLKEDWFYLMVQIDWEYIIYFFKEISLLKIMRTVVDYCIPLNDINILN